MKVKIIYIKKYFLKLICVAALSLGVVNVSSAVSAVVFVGVDINTNNISGTCRVTVASPPNPITYSHKCDLLTRVGSSSVAVSDSDPINLSKVPLPNGTSSVIQQSFLLLNQPPSPICRYCARVRQIRVKNSQGTTLLFDNDGSEFCDRKQGITVFIEKINMDVDS